MNDEHNYGEPYEPEDGGMWIKKPGSSKSKLNPDKIPRNLDEAVEMVKEVLTEADIASIKNGLSPIDVHFTTGMNIRNDWSLWDKGNPLVKGFWERYGIDHADDISGIILDCVWRDILGEPRRDRQIAKENKKYWETLKEAEETGTSIIMEINKDGTVKILKKEDNDETK